MRATAETSKELFYKHLGEPAMRGQPLIKELHNALAEFRKKRTKVLRVALEKLHDARKVWYGDEVTLKSEIEEELRKPTQPKKVKS